MKPQFPCNWFCVSTAKTKIHHQLLCFAFMHFPSPCAAAPRSADTKDGKHLAMYNDSPTTSWAILLLHHFLHKKKY